MRSNGRAGAAPARPSVASGRSPGVASPDQDPAPRASRPARSAVVVPRRTHSILSIGARTVSPLTISRPPTHPAPALPVCHRAAGPTCYIASVVVVAARARGRHRRRCARRRPGHCRPRRGVRDHDRDQRQSGSSASPVPPRGATVVVGGSVRAGAVAGPVSVGAAGSSATSWAATTGGGGGAATVGADVVATTVTTAVAAGSGVRAAAMTTAARLAAVTPSAVLAGGSAGTVVVVDDPVVVVDGSVVDVVVATTVVVVDDVDVVDDADDVDDAGAAPSTAGPSPSSRRPPRAPTPTAARASQPIAAPPIPMVRALMGGIFTPGDRPGPLRRYERSRT